jgi:transposase
MTQRSTKPNTTQTTRAPRKPKRPSRANPPRARRSPKQATDLEPEIAQLARRYGSREIARRLGVSRKVVMRLMRKMGLSSEPPGGRRPSKLEPFREAIRTRVDKDLTTTRILREVRVLGYTGGRSILARYASRLRAERGRPPSRVVKRRFETAPGREMQVDWSPYDVSIGGTIVPVHALGCLLCASRKLYLRFFRDERQSTLLEALASAFEYFGGVAARLVLDNRATAVLGRFSVEHEVLWHPRFLDFARHYGFEPFACLPGDPDRKGKKEKSFRLVHDDFLKGTDFESWIDLDVRRAQWLDGTPDVGNERVHGTTRRRVNDAWREEQPFLIRLPEKRFAVHEDGVRIIDADSTISMRGTRYSVPSTLANHSVAVRMYAEHFEVLDPLGKVAFSRCYVPDEDKGRLQIDKTHYASLPRRGRRRTSERLDEALVARFPSLAPLVQGLRLRFKSLAHIHYRALVRLVERYGEAAFVEAAERAQHYRRFDAHAVGRILEQEHPLPEHDRPAPLSGIGPLVLGEVEPPSLDSYAALDGARTAAPDPDPNPDPDAGDADSDADDADPPCPPEEPHRGT